MPIINKIKNNLDNFSNSELRIAQYIMNQPHDVIDMTVQELAKSSDSGAASVIRLGKKINVAGFTQLKIELAADLTQDSLGAEHLRIDISKNENANSIKDKLLYNAQTALQATVNQIENKHLLQVSKLLTHAHHLFIFGVGASYLTAQNIAQKWGRIGVVATAFSDLNGILPVLANANPDDLVWIISNSGESTECVQVAKWAKKFAVPILSLTSQGDNTICRLSTLAAHTSKPIETRDRIAATNSLLSQFMIIDIIFYDYVSQNYEESIVKLNRSAEVIRKRNNIPKKEIN